MVSEDSRIARGLPCTESEILRCAQCMKNAVRLLESLGWLVGFEGKVESQPPLCILSAGITLRNLAHHSAAASQALTFDVQHAVLFVLQWFAHANVGSLALIAPCIGQ
jgi:hypothetical protein